MLFYNLRLQLIDTNHLCNLKNKYRQKNINVSSK